MTDEYPRQMRHPTGYRVTATAPPGPDGFQPYVNGSGYWGVSKGLAPIPSPDDEVDVVVKMTRRQRDDFADYYEAIVPTSEGAGILWPACAAARDAEAES